MKSLRFILSLLSSLTHSLFFSVTPQPPDDIAVHSSPMSLSNPPPGEGTAEPEIDVEVSDSAPSESPSQTSFDR